MTRLRHTKQVEQHCPLPLPWYLATLTALRVSICHNCKLKEKSMPLNICKTQRLGCLKTCLTTLGSVRKSVFQPQILNTTDCKKRVLLSCMGLRTRKEASSQETKPIFSLWSGSLRNGLITCTSSYRLHFLHTSLSWHEFLLPALSAMENETS